MHQRLEMAEMAGGGLLQAADAAQGKNTGQTSVTPVPRLHRDTTNKLCHSIISYQYHYHYQPIIMITNPNW